MSPMPATKTAANDFRSYYQHARALGNFRAIDCFYLAHQAAGCDASARAARIPPPSLVSHEGAQRLSFAIKVF